MQSRRFPTSRKLLLLIGDIILIGLAYILATALALDRDVLMGNIYLYSGMLPVILILSGLLLNINGLYSIANKRFAEIILSLGVAIFCVFILVMALSFFVREFAYSRMVLVFSLALEFVFLLVWRHIHWRIKVKQEIYLNLVKECEQDKIKEAMESMDIQIIDPANLPDEDKPAGPRKMLITAIGLVIGCLISFGYGLICYKREEA